MSSVYVIIAKETNQVYAVVESKTDAIKVMWESQEEIKDYKLEEVGSLTEPSTFYLQHKTNPRKTGLLYIEEHAFLKKTDEQKLLEGYNDVTFETDWELDFN